MCAGEQNQGAIFYDRLIYLTCGDASACETIIIDRDENHITHLGG